MFLCMRLSALCDLRLFLYGVCLIFGSCPFYITETKALSTCFSKVLQMHLCWYLPTELHSVAYAWVNLVLSFKIGPQLQNCGTYECKFLSSELTLISVDFRFHFAVWDSKSVNVYINTLPIMTTFEQIRFNTLCYKQSNMCLVLEGSKLLLCAAV
jgi:hypothetical protein